MDKDKDINIGKDIKIDEEVSKEKGVKKEKKTVFFTKNKAEKPEKKPKEPKPPKAPKEPKPPKAPKEPKPPKAPKEPKPPKAPKEPKPPKASKPKKDGKGGLFKKNKDGKSDYSHDISEVTTVNKIQTKLIVAFMIPVVLFVVVGMINYSISEQGLKENAESLTYTSVDTLKEYFELGFQSIELTGTRICVNSDVNSHFGGLYENTFELDAKTAVVTEAVADKYILNIVAFSENQKNSLSNTGVVKGKDLYNTFVGSATGKEVEQKMENGKCWISTHPEVDDMMNYSDNQYALSYVNEILDSNNKPVGYLLIDVKSSFIKDILDNAKVGSNSIKGFVTSDGKEVISGPKGFKFSDKKFFNEIKNSKEGGYKYVSYKGESYLFLYDKVSYGDGIVCVLVPKAVIVEKANDIRLFTVLTIIACCIIAVVIGSILALGISKTINKINDVMKQTAEGDLTGKLQVNRKDEFRLLSGNIGNMIFSIKKLIKKMTRVSEQVQDSAVQVNDNSDVLYEATKDIKTSIEFIEQGLIQQSEDTESCLRQMSDLSDRINAVSDSTVEIGNIANKTQETVNNGMGIVTELGERVKDTTDITKNIIEDIASLEQESRAINSIISTINEIAEETNLLSLNASIEAARAGEAGRGFAVVSDEIRKLAEQSSEAAEQISEIIDRIQSRVKVTISTAMKAEDIVNYQAEALGTTVNVFQEIRGQVDTLAQDLDTISVSVKGMEEAKNDTMEAIASISTTSNETEAASTELTKSAERQMQAVEVLNTAVKQLQLNSNELDESISVFKVDDK